MYNALHRNETQEHCKVDELEQLRQEMIKYLAGTFVERRSTGERAKADYDWGVQHYSTMSNMQLLEEYGSEKWKDGQDSMSLY